MAWRLRPNNPGLSLNVVWQTATNLLVNQIWSNRVKLTDLQISLITIFVPFAVDMLLCTAYCLMRYCPILLNDSYHGGLRLLSRTHNLMITYTLTNRCLESVNTMHTLYRTERYNYIQWMNRLWVVEDNLADFILFFIIFFSAVFLSENKRYSIRCVIHFSLWQRYNVLWNKRSENF